VVQVDGRSYQISLRLKRYYKPYTLHLIDFSHDRYQGTEIAKNFASHVRLVDPTQHQDREVQIWMNHPLRYGGETFYQASFKPGDKTSILQVVSNPAWLLPYIACVVGGLGMVIHFGMHLVGFIARRGAERTEIGSRTTRLDSRAELTGQSKTEYTLEPARRWTRAGFLFPAIITGLCIIYLGAKLRTPEQATAFDVRGFATLPVSYEGRVQPLDSLARNSLKIISGRETLKTDMGRAEAIYWLMDMFARPEQADTYKVFRIDHPDLVNMISPGAKETRFSFSQLLGAAKKLEEQFAQVAQIEPKQYDRYQKAVDQLRQKAQLYIMLQSKEPLLLIPPMDGAKRWQTFGEAMHGAQQQNQPPANPAAMTLGALLQSYSENRPAEFNSVLRAYMPLLQEKLPEMKKVSFEAFFNRYDPFTQCMVLYLRVFVLVSLSWLLGRGDLATPLSRAAFGVLSVGFVLHTLGLAARVYISGRPPVTNLASSAIFIAWGVTALAIGLEWLFRNGIGAITAAVIGFLSLLIADYLALSGDTMKVLVAVLDTNFWLATHVTTITLGYASTFLAGFLGIVYVLRGMFTKSLTEEQSKGLSRMIYGIVCFAMLFSFVGTILGGIWADQSWGRFWGWDPKENGAALLVLYNALILHARWARMVRERGLALLAIGGNIVTSWSWFGTNMLGVGLHSYGFMDSALFWLLVFALTQGTLILLGGLVPLERWRSFTGKGAMPVVAGGV
ncbi:MAG: cytochrome c biogenesis protein CcsA, partial [Bacillota bacterium]